MDHFHLLECTINVLSTEVSASDAQVAPLIDILTPGRKKRIRLPFASVWTMSEVDDNLAIRRVGDSLLQYVKESKHISWYLTLTFQQRELEPCLYELSKTNRENQIARIRSKEDSKKVLLNNFITGDETELRCKQEELVNAVTTLNGLDAET